MKSASRPAENEGRTTEEASLFSGPRIETPRPLTDEQIRFYVEQGFLVIPNLLQPEEVEELRRDVLHLARGGYPAEGLEALPTGLSDEETLAHILCIHQPHFVSPVMRRYVAHPLIAGALSQIVGAHLRGGTAA